MILFRDDWNRYPSAKPDYDTINKSWVRLAGIYHRMGIDNCLFHLALHNPDLVGVDPHDPDLSQADILAIVVESKENPWYFLREVLRVPAVATNVPPPLKANRGNISLFFLFFNHVTTMLIQPRQTGKSVSVDSLFVTLFSVVCTNTDFNLLTKDDNLRVKNVKRLKDIIETLPYYFNLRNRRDSNNTEKLSLSALGNTYNTSVAQASEKAALNLGRGSTIPINQIDEIAFITNIHITLPALLAASGAARDSAKAAGAPYGNLFTTTAGYLNSKSGAYAHEIYQRSLRWSEVLFDTENTEALHKVIATNSPGKSIRVLLDFNHRQLGYTDEWLREKISESGAVGENAEADFLNTWATGSEVSPIDKGLMKIIRDSVVKDPHTQISNFGYLTRWYVSDTEVEEKLSTRHIIASLDTSDATGRDDIGLCFRDTRTGEVLGGGIYNETNLITFSEWIADLLIEYPNMTLVPERKSSAIAIIDNLIKILLEHDIDPFARIFNWVVNDAAVNAGYRDTVVNVPFRRRHSEVYVKYRDKFGFATSGGGRTSRGMLYGEIFSTSVKYTGHLTKDAILIEQIAGLTVKNGRIDHSADSTDDLVIAWLLGYWFLSPKTENKEFYGIPKHLSLSTVTDAMISEKGGSEAIAEKNYQLETKSKIDDLITKIRSTVDPVETYRLTNRVMMLYGEIDTTVIKSFNIESVLESIKLSKRAKNRR